MREQERALRAVFITAASIRLPDGAPLMAQPDLQQFFADLQLADVHRFAFLSQADLEQRYAEALQIQTESIQLGGGLLFWSFKALLNNLIRDLGLGWSKLVEQTLLPADMELGEKQISAT